MSTDTKKAPGKGAGDGQLNCILPGTQSSIQIDPEFRDLIPPLSTEEFAGLEASIKREGCRDAIVLWGNTLIDGHNRFEICTRHGIAFQTRALLAEDRRAAMIWIIRNQFDRRNLNPAQRMDLALLLKAEIQVQAQARMKAGKAVDPVQNSAQGRTRDEVAKLAGVSHDTLSKYEKVKATAAPEVLEAVRADEISVSRAAEIAKLPANEQVEAVRIPRVTLNTGNFEWYTPSDIIEAAREVMGSIDTDPASCEFANRTVKAGQYFTKEQDGLTQPWSGNVWMNPPYSQPLITQFCESVTTKYANGEITQAIVLCNNTTETVAAHMLFHNAGAACFTKGRIKFVNPVDPDKAAPTQGQMIIYLGPNVEAFARAFGQFGSVLQPVEDAA